MSAVPHWLNGLQNSGASSWNQQSARVNDCKCRTVHQEGEVNRCKVLFVLDSWLWLLIKSSLQPLKVCVCHVTCGTSKKINLMWWHVFGFTSFPWILSPTTLIDLMVKHHQNKLVLKVHVIVCIGRQCCRRFHLSLLPGVPTWLTYIFTFIHGCFAKEQLAYSHLCKFPPARWPAWWHRSGEIDMCCFLLSPNQAHCSWIRKSKPCSSRHLFLQTIPAHWTHYVERSPSTLAWWK